MKLKELIAELQKHDGEMEVVVGGYDTDTSEDLFGDPVVEIERLSLHHCYTCFTTDDDGDEFVAIVDCGVETTFDENGKHVLLTERTMSQHTKGEQT